MLCSYANVGKVLTSWTKDEGGTYHSPWAHTGKSRPEMAAEELMWASHTSQQCVVNVGLTPADPGAHLLWLKVASSDQNATGANRTDRGLNQVRVLAIYYSEDAPRAAGLQT